MRSSVIEQDTFTERVDAWVAGELERGSSSFGALLRALPGIDPGLVAASLERFAARGSCAPGPRVLATTLLLTRSVKWMVRRRR